jgi:succinate-semialdehyde dehydrogenase/glutarate-semialdehyde dehydrogenase
MITAAEAAQMAAGTWTPKHEPALTVTDPATDAVVGYVPRMSNEDVRTVISASEKALISWRRTTALERSNILHSFGALLMQHQERLAHLLTREQGKPLSEALGEIRYAASFLEWSAGEARRIYGQLVPAPRDNQRIMVLKQPIGVTAAITPWNFPSAMITRKLGPALAAGCTMVVKPSELTPLSALALVELAHEAGLPPNVFSVVTGDPEPIGDALMSHKAVRMLSFTGSTAVGRILMKKASRNVMRLGLELGGHAPFIVFDDADIEQAVAAAIACKFRNAGQTCICANRFLIQRTILDVFVERFQNAVTDLQLGHGLEDGVSIGPLINDRAVSKVIEHLDDAVERGAKLLTGGKVVAPEGLTSRFISPTVIRDVTPDMRIFHEETFGPVAPITAFDTEEEAVSLANATDYGLAAYFFTKDASRLMRVAEQLEYGIVGANDGAPSTAEAPFGGMKQSGLGREGGHFAVEEYLEVKYVSWRI